MQYSKIIIFYFMINVSIYAERIIVSDPHFAFDLRYSLEEIRLIGKYNVHIKKEECNKKILKKFYYQMSLLLKNSILSKAPNTIKLEIKERVYFTSLNNSLGKKVIQLPERVYALKMNEVLNCEDKD